MSVEHCSGDFSDQTYCWWPSAWQEMRLGLFQKHYVPCESVLM